MAEAELSAEHKSEHGNLDAEDAFVLDVVEILDESDSDSTKVSDPLWDNNLVNESSTSTHNKFHHQKRCVNYTKIDDKINNDACAKKFKIASDHKREHSAARRKKKEEEIFPHNLRSQRLRQNYLKNVIQSVTNLGSHISSKPSTRLYQHKATFLCADCGCGFINKRTLQNHIKKLHITSNLNSRKMLKKFECAECGKKFTKKYNLIIHLKTIHKQTFINTSCSKPFTCFICEKRFSQNYNLKVHLQSIHKLTNLEPKKDKPFTCSVCKKCFGRKHTLKIHFSTIHGLELEPKKEKKFQCPMCQKLFSRKPNLLRHSWKKHPQYPDLKCLTCAKKFLTEEEIRIHVEKCSRKQAVQILKSERIKNKIIQQTIVCALCKLTLHKVADMRRHYENDHDLDMSSECLTFVSDEEFLAWKCVEETNNRCSYSRYRSYNIQKAKYVDYFCSRSGFYKDKNQGLRGRRAIGSKKINACCPAQIKVKYLGNLITVKYLRTHVGHDNKLCYMNLTKVERELILEELRKGRAPQEILQKVKYPLPASEDERRKIHLLTVQDIRNIAVTAGIDYKKGRFYEQKCVEDVAAWVDEHLDSVLYYKPQDQIDKNFPSLEKDDFLLVFMTEKQRLKLEKLGNKVILVDSTNDSDKRDHVLTTLMVLENDDESYPCCFMFSSRIDDTFLNIFYECIRENISLHSLSQEALQTKIFMSGLQDCYFSSWIKVFPKPSFRLFSPWHVMRNWRDNLNTITSSSIAKDVEKALLPEELKKLKDEVYKFLIFDLMEQRDITIFTKELNTFLKIDNPALRSFQTFFKQTYLSNKEMWAYCYREKAGLKPNAFTESFQKILKYQQATGKKVGHLNQALVAVFSYLEKKNEVEILREEKGIQDIQKLRTLRRRHMDSLKGNKLPIMALGTNEWIVSSDSSKNGEKLCESYFIKKCDNNCVNCYLTCRECGVCLHDFECTCADYCTFNNMCKHIHLLCQSKELFTSSIKLVNDDLTYNSIEEEEEEVLYDLEPACEEVEYEIINAVDLETLKCKEESNELFIKEDVDLKNEVIEKDVQNVTASREECAEVKEQFNKVLSGISSSPQMLNVAKKWVQQFSSIITACEMQNPTDVSRTDC